MASPIISPNPHWALIDKDDLSDGTELCLYGRGGDFMVRAGGYELMTTDAHRSEEVFVASGLTAFGSNAPHHILIGGLGFGYTLAEALRLTVASQICVVEISAKMIDWNRGQLTAVNGPALADPRTCLVEQDLIAFLYGSDDPIDLALLDIDNGPEPLVHEDNEKLYSVEGLGRLATRLSPGGVVVFWSAIASADFEERLKLFFCDVHTEVFVLPQNPRVEHVFFVGKNPIRSSA